MSALHDMARDITRLPPLQILSVDRMSATERAAAQLENRRIGGARGAPAAPETVEAIDRIGLRRLLGTLWSDPRWNVAAARIVARSREIGARSLDRAIILAYLRAYPATHAAFDDLRAAAAAASEAHDWAWSARGERWGLWTPAGPALVRNAIAADAIDDPPLLRLLTASAFLASDETR